MSVPVLVEPVIEWTQAKWIKLPTNLTLYWAAWRKPCKALAGLVIKREMDSDFRDVYQRELGKKTTSKDGDWYH